MFFAARKTLASVIVFTLALGMVPSVSGQAKKSQNEAKKPSQKTVTQSDRSSKNNSSGKVASGQKPAEKQKTEKPKKVAKLKKITFLFLVVEFNIS